MLLFAIHLSAILLIQIGYQMLRGLVAIMRLVVALSVLALL